MSLTGTAAQCVSGCIRDHACYSEIVATLERRFGTRNLDSAYKCQLKARRRKKGESLRDLCMDIDRLAGLAYPHTKSDTWDSIVVDAFIDALDDDDLSLIVRDKEPRTLDDAYQFAVRLESHRMTRKPERSWNTDIVDKYDRRARQAHYEFAAPARETDKRGEHNFETETSVRPDLTRQLLQQQQQQIVQQAQRIAQLESVRAPPPPQYSIPPLLLTTPVPQYPPPQFQNPLMPLPRSPTSTTCYFCSQIGHISRYCPNRPPAPRPYQARAVHSVIPLCKRQCPENNNANYFVRGVRSVQVVEPVVYPPRRRIQCYNCLCWGSHIARTCPELWKGRRCRTCGLFGHVARACRQRAPRPRVPHNPPTCFSCHEIGHGWRQCLSERRHPEVDERGETDAGPSEYPAESVPDEREPPLPEVEESRVIPVYPSSDSSGEESNDPTPLYSPSPPQRKTLNRHERRRCRAIRRMTDRALDSVQSIGTFPNPILVHSRA
jgi:hypothetical protein